MTNQELCTQYELIVALIKSGNADEAVRILENSIRRIDRSYAAEDKEADRKKELVNV